MRSCLLVLLPYLVFAHIGKYECEERICKKGCEKAGCFWVQGEPVKCSGTCHSQPVPLPTAPPAEPPALPPTQACEPLEVEACNMPKNKKGKPCYARCCKERNGCTWNRVSRECQESRCDLHPKLGKNCGPRCCTRIQDEANCEWDSGSKTCGEKYGACFTKRNQPTYKSPSN